MKQITIRDTQSWFDIAIQETGSIENVFALMQATDKIDDSLSAGRKLNIDTNISGEMMVKQYYTRNAITPATGLAAAQAPGEGIGFWIIGQDFIIS